MPIIKDKTFVFFALERTRELTELPVSAAAFAQLTLAKPLGAVPTNSIPTPFSDQRYNGRLDHRFSPSQSLSMAYTSQSNTGLNDQALTTNDLTAGNFTTNRMILASASLSSVLSPFLVNSFTTGYQYWNNVIDSNNKVPYVLFPSASFGTNPNVPQQSIQAKWQFKDDVSITHGRHTIKTGFDFVTEPKLGGFFQTPSTLNVTFQDDPSTILSNTAKYPNGFSTPGAVTAMSASSGNPYFTSSDAKMFGLYVQDDWKVTRRLNINIGLRWDKDYNLNGGNTQALGRTTRRSKPLTVPLPAECPRTATRTSARASALLMT
jgi:outer membrane receptor protein involved in Fe transport